MKSDDRTQTDILRRLRSLPLPMPEDLAQLLQLLGLYDPRDGLTKLLSRLDLTKTGPREIYSTVLGRAPDNIDMAVVRPGYDPYKHLEEAIRAPEFQRSASRNFLRVFADKKRDVFIHIPKCAGTDLILNLAPDRLSLPRLLDFEKWISKDDFFAALGGLVQAAPYYDRIFVYGHIQLGEYFDIAGFRQTDRLFTVVRDPVELLLSQANYAVTRLYQDPEGLEMDTREILVELGLDSFPASIDPAQLKRLAARCLMNGRISQHNRICYYLGKAETATYERAIEHIVTFDIEVTNTANYKRWLFERWGVSSDSRHNESAKVLTTEEVRRALPEQLKNATSEDQKLFDVVSWVLEQTGRSVTSGREIAKLAGSELLHELPAKLAQERAPRRAMVVVQGDLVPCFDESIPEDLGALKIAVVADYSFAQRGNGIEIKKFGWAEAEAEFTWTNAEHATIVLRARRAGNDYVLRIRCKPYLIGDRLTSQRVEILIDGQEAGSAELLEDEAILECNLSFSKDMPVEVTLRLPDAARPSDLGHENDERLLGLAVSSVQLLQPVSAHLPETADPDTDSVIQPLDQLMLVFESLGENCEFGLVQRRCGAEPLGLFRFSSAPLPRLLKALHTKFKGMGRIDNIEVQPSSNGKEYMVLDKRFGFLYHAWVLVGEKEPDEIALRESRRVPLLIRKLIEDISLGEKIFVYHGMDPLTLPQAKELFAALCLYGPATLLWTELADDKHIPGTVEQIEPGFFRGYMDRFAPGENAHDLSLECWITICRNAYRAWKSD